MRRQQAFGGREKMLKGALHCHSTRSDGRNTPEEVIRAHYTLGYDFIALTDHNIYNYKHFVPEVPLTVIPGMEFETLEFCVDGKGGYRGYHSGCIGPLKEDGNGIEQDEFFDRMKLKHTEEGLFEYLAEFRKKGNLTIINHPQWSGANTELMRKRTGDIAMEIWNTGCAERNYCDRNAAYWDDLLGLGKVLYGVATDDSHFASDWGGGWVMVRAQNDIRSILEALKEGRFYSSCGPEIYDFYVEDDVAVVECSSAAMVSFHSDMHMGYVIRSIRGDITRVEYDFKKNDTGYGNYIRAMVVDTKGRQAWTNPIFFDEKGCI